MCLSRVLFRLFSLIISDGQIRDTNIYPTRISFLLIGRAQYRTRKLDGCTNTHSNPAFEIPINLFHVLFSTTAGELGAHEATNGPKQKWSQLDGPQTVWVLWIAYPECGYDSNIAFSFVYIYEGQTSGPEWSTVGGIYTYGTR